MESLVEPIGLCIGEVSGPCVLQIFIDSKLASNAYMAVWRLILLVLLTVGHMVISVGRCGSRPQRVGLLLVYSISKYHLWQTFIPIISTVFTNFGDY